MISGLETRQDVATPTDFFAIGDGIEQQERQHEGGQIRRER